jgi:hypothetical protein
MSDSEPQDKPKTPRKVLDWEAIERDYRAGVLSDRELGKRHGCSHTAIQNRAKAKRWVKDLTARVANRVKTALVVREVAEEPAQATDDGNGKPDGGNPGNPGNKAEDRRQAEARTVEEAARTVVEVVRSHRHGIQKASALVHTLMGQLGEAAECRETLRDLIEDETDGDRSPTRRLGMLKAVSIPAHAGTIRDLATAMQRLVTLERQAFNIAELTTPEPDLPPEPERTPEETDPALHVTLLKLSLLTGVPVPTPDPAAHAPTPTTEPASGQAQPNP